MIDLSKFVDKKVRVTLRNGCICEGEVSLNTSMNRVYNPYYFKNNAYECSFTLEGFELDSDEPTAGDIIHIEEIKPMIDLSKFVDKKVRVTFRNGSKREVRVCESIWHECGNETFCLSEKPGNPLYSSSGTYLSDAKSNEDIIQIEEIKPMNKYEELEKQVAEMQKEIDRLKAQEEKKQTFEGDIRSILLTDTQHHRHRIDYLTQKICETVENYIPNLRENPTDYYDVGYNIAICKMRQNLGLKLQHSPTKDLDASTPIQSTFKM